MPPASSTSSKVVIEPRDPLTQSEGVVQGYAQTARRWPSHPLQRRPQTAAELSGPSALARLLANGQPIAAGAGDGAGHGAQRANGQLIHPRVRGGDEDGVPLDGMPVGIWDCNAAGKNI